MNKQHEKKEFIMRKVIRLLSVVLVMAAAGSAGAASESNLAQENAELKQRIEKLDKELDDIKKTVMQRTGTAQTRMPVWSNLDIQFYGYLKFDAAYDSSRINNGNYAQWVEREDSRNNDNQFNMTVNQSRFGMKINGPHGDVMNASGRVEVDVYGNAPAENKAQLMMRHAYMKLDWPEDRFNIIAGQTTDVISPLFPSTVNYGVCWWTGNIGYRRPQIRLTKECGLDAETDLKLEGALVRTIGRNSLSGTESGEDSGLPSLQARASLSLPLYGSKPTTMGVSGHLGEEEYDTLTSEKEFNTWSLNLDVTQPVNSWLTIKGELFTGENLDAYFGGIGQGVITNTARPNHYKEIGSTGGWIAAGLGPWDDMRFNVGGGMDDVDSGQINSGDRTMNRSIFGNMFYAINNNTELAMELSHWRTEYYGPGDGDSLRVQTALIYKF